MEDADFTQELTQIAEFQQMIILNESKQSLKEINDILAQVYSSEYVQKLVTILASGHALSYLAARQLVFLSRQSNFIDHVSSLGLPAICFSLLKLPVPSLRFEIIRLLEVILSLASAKEKVFAKASPSFFKSFEILVDLLCLKLFKNDTSNSETSQNMNSLVDKACVFRQERVAILNILNASVYHHKSVRDSLKNKGFDSLFVNGLDSELIPLIQTLSKAERLIYRSIVTVLQLTK